MPTVMVLDRSVTRLKRVSVATHRNVYEPQPPDESAIEDTDVLARGRSDGAVLLTFDSELDKPETKSLWQFALIRRIDSVDASQRDALREELVAHKRFRFFYLPAQQDDPAFDERYVDLRRITTVRASAVDPDGRIATMTLDLRQMFRRQIARQYARLEKDE
jgi:hypothetical protein